MKGFLLTFLLAFTSSAFAESKDIAILHESIIRLEKILTYYDTDIASLLKRYKDEEHVIFNRDERTAINTFWTQFIDTRITMHTIYNAHRSEESSYTKRLILYTVNLHLQLSAATLSYNLWSNENARKALNETNKNEIPRGSFINLENELFRSLRPKSESIALEMPTMFPVYQLEQDARKFKNMLKPNMDELSVEIENLNNIAEARFSIYKGFVKKSRNALTVQKRFIVYKFKNVFYAVVKKISTWLGDTKSRERNPDNYNGQTLIDLKMAKEMERKVHPGDIMISRTNWFLSNMFLPGFWPHSFIYIGNKNKVEKYFNDDEVNTYYFNKCLTLNLACTHLVSFLAVSPTTKNAWQAHQVKDKHGFDKVLIEATSDGVHFSSIKHTFLNDYLAAIRPKTSKLTKAQSIEDAMASFGLEYDFDFDYTTDDRVVCSELVAKSYAARIDKPDALELNYDSDKEKYLSVTVGRLSLPVVNFVHKIYDENVLKLRAPQFDFVAFLKGDPKNKEARFSTEKDFYASRLWPKWDFMN
ncbi:MAG: hypothetical protein HON90_04890 [Halobacteriovoraceae bacterium]|jgi:hypothetical protein|nr:hypothetical protein [Halobacteriovoraceae bacterium]